MEIEKKLKDLGYELPSLRGPAAGNYVPLVRTGNLVFLSGHGAGLPEGGFLHLGKLGSDLTIEQGYDCARQTMLNLLASLKEGKSVASSRANRKFSGVFPNVIR